MNMLISDATDWVGSLLGKPPFAETVEVVVAPPFTALAAVEERIRRSCISLAGQNIGPEPEGARTGEISAAMLKDAGCRFVILGHSERRKHFFETDAFISRKIGVALDSGLGVIFCVGESLEERESEHTRQVIEHQLSEGLNGLDVRQFEGLVIAYEPVWAIGTGRTATPEQAQHVHRIIRDWARQAFGESSAENVRILYGGSVTPETSGPLTVQPDIDGLLVGGASLKSDSFYDIICSIK
jgi:triosephosphate isomerase